MSQATGLTVCSPNEVSLTRSMEVLAESIKSAPGRGMPTRRLPRFALLAAAVVVLPLTSSATPGPVSSEAVDVNLASFGNEFGGEDPRNVIRTAMTSWTAYAGGRETFHVDQVTTNAGCGWFGTKPHIYGTTALDCAPECPLTCDCTLAVRQGCFLGGWVIAVYINNRQFSLFPMTSGQTDFQHVIQHELGHKWTGHIDDDTCVMNSSPAVENAAQRYFCNGDLAALRANPDIGTEQIRKATNLVWPTPDDTSWSSVGLSVNSGRGFASLLRGVTDYIVETGVNTNITTMVDYYGNGGGLPSFANTSLRPGSAYDPIRARHWIFTVDSYYNIIVLYYQNGAWTTVGTMSNGSASPRTRVPPTATYDHLTDSIVVAFNNWGGTKAYPPCPGPFGCSGDLNVAVLSASGPTPIGSITRFGNSLGSWSVAGWGTPTVACDDVRDPSGFQCEVVLSSLNQFRLIEGQRFGVSLSRTVTGWSSNYNLGDATGYPISMHNVPGSDFVVLMVSFDNLVHLKTKPWIGSPWGPTWFALVTGGTTYLETKTGAEIRARGGGINSYDIIY